MGKLNRLQQSRYHHETELQNTQESEVVISILPVMHLSKYDPTLVSPSYLRQGLSAVKHGYPITIANSKLRLALFNLGLADAIILSQEKIAGPIDPLAIKYRFRLQPFKVRQNLPTMTQALGISEDSEAVESHIKRNPSLFDQSSYSCQ